MLFYNYDPSISALLFMRRERVQNDLFFIVHLYKVVGSYHLLT